MSSFGGVVPRRVYLYEDPSAATIDLRAVAETLRKMLGLTATVRREFLSLHSRESLQELGAQTAATRVIDFSRPYLPLEPPPALVLFERRLLDDPARKVPGVLYDGFRLQGIYRGLLPPKERSLAAAHIAFTSRLLGTFDDADRRYHARAIILGAPAIISTSGIVEGPAKPREFYAAKRGLRIDSADARYEALKQEYASRFLDYDDARMTPVAIGYVLQALFYLITGDAFCNEPECLLFNAHWQEELLAAQMGGLLCSAHRQIAQAVRAELRATPGGRRTRPR